MVQSNFLKGKNLLILFGLILVSMAIVGLYFWFTSSGNLVDTRITSEPSPTLILSSMPVISPSPSAPASPAMEAVSPISPVSPIQRFNEEVDPEVQAMVHQAVSLYEQQNYQEAKKLLDEILNRDPHNELAHNAMGSVYTALKDYNRAITEYTTVINLHPLFAPAFYNRGRVYNFLEKYDEAVADFQISIDINPSDFGYRAKGNIGLIYHQQGKYDQAIEAFADAMKYDDSKADTYYFRGETYTAMGNYSAAIADYEAALTRFSRYDLAQQGLGYAYYKTKQFDRAMAALDKAAELTPNQPVTSFYRMLVYLATNQPDKAKTEAAQAVQYLDSLPADKQELLLPRILADLNTLAQENSKQAGVIEEIVKLIPQ